MRRWPTIWRQQRLREPAYCMHKAYRHCRAKLVGFLQHIDIKEHLADNAHGQTDHFPIEINYRLIGPRTRDQLAILHNRLGVIDNVAWLKHRGNQLTLLAMKVAFGGEEAIALDGLMNQFAFGKSRAPVNQNCLDMLRLVEEENRYRTQVKATDIAGPGQALDCAQTITHKSVQAAEKWCFSDKWDFFSCEPLGRSEHPSFLLLSISFSQGL